MERKEYEAIVRRLLNQDGLRRPIKKLAHMQYYRERGPLVGPKEHEHDWDDTGFAECSCGAIRTSIGRVISADEMDLMVAEAEQGYCVVPVDERPCLRPMPCADHPEEKL